MDELCQSDSFVRHIHDGKLRCFFQRKYSLGFPLRRIADAFVSLLDSARTSLLEHMQFLPPLILASTSPSAPHQGHCSSKTKFEHPRSSWGAASAGEGEECSLLSNSGNAGRLRRGWDLFC